MTRKKQSTESASKKQTTIQKRQQSLKAKLLLVLEEMPIVQYAASRVGIDRSTYYRWRTDDDAFRDRVETAQEKGRDLVNDMMESLLTKQAKEGNMTAIIFWLKHNHQRYANRIIHRYEEDRKLTPEEIADIEKKLEMWSFVSKKVSGERFVSQGGENPKKEDS